jgi:hypothetical protein
LSELNEFESLQTARQYVIDAEIESVIRDSHADHFKYIEKAINITLKPREEAWRIFLELMERRNLLAHTGGIISRSYLSNCAKYRIPIPNTAKLGKKIAGLLGAGLAGRAFAQAAKSMGRPNSPRPSTRS